MRAIESPVKHAVQAGGRIAGHWAAMVIGFAMVAAGLGLGVTIVLLPVGLPLGLAGLMLFFWGVSTQWPWGQRAEDRPKP
jgi:hypothetical protein